MGLTYPINPLQDHRIYISDVAPSHLFPVAVTTAYLQGAFDSLLGFPLAKLRRRVSFHTWLAGHLSVKTGGGNHFNPMKEIGDFAGIDDIKAVEIVASSRWGTRKKGKKNQNNPAESQEWWASALLSMLRRVGTNACIHDDASTNWPETSRAS